MKKSVVKNLFITILSFLFIIGLSSCSFRISTKSTTTEKIELKEDMITLYGDKKVYTGETITLSDDNFSIIANGRNIHSSTLIITYENNIEVGIATVIFTAKEDNEFVYGSARKTFEIIPNYEAKYVNNYDELKEVLSTNHYTRIEVNFDLTVPKGDTLNVRGGKSLNLNKVSIDLGYKGGTFVNNGTINIEEGSKITVGGYREYTVKFYNNGTITGDGGIHSYSNGFIYNAGVISTKETTTIYGALYTNSDLDHEILGSGTYVKRKNLADTIITTNIEDSKLVFNTDTLKNRAEISIDGERYYLVDYTSYENIGTVTYTINPTLEDTKYYGSYTGEYELVRGEVTFRGYEEFKLYYDTGNYYKYTQIKGAQFDAVDPIIIRDYEELYLTNAKFSSGLINYGYIEHTSVLTIVGDLYNYKEINCTAGYSVAISVTGDLYNGSESYKDASINSNITRGNNKEIKTVYNYGTIGEDYTIYIEQKVINYESGKISSPTVLSFYSDVVNYGEISNGTRLFFYEKSSLENKVEGRITFGGSGIFYGTSFNNEGSIINKATILISDQTTILSNASFDNKEGVIWGFRDSIDGINENYHKREYLNTQDVTLSFNVVPYDKLEHIATVLVNGEEIDTTKCTITYLRNQKETTDFTSYGYITVNVKITADYYEYAGNYNELFFKIDYGSTTASNHTELRYALNNLNYGEITLTGDVEYPYSSSTNTLTISSSQTVYTNGHSIKLNMTTINIYGELNISKIGDERTSENIGLYLYRTSSYNVALNLYSGGKIVNNGLVYIEESYPNVWINEGSSFINNGEVFTIANVESKITGDGYVYIRKALVADSIELSYTEIDYDGQIKEPEVIVKLNDQILDISKYTISYEDNTNAGKAKVIVTNNDMFNEYHYGKGSTYFNINKIVKYLNYNIFDRDFDDEINYYKYALTQNATLKENITIPNGTILDLGEYRITMSTNNINRTITLGDGVEVLITVASAEDLIAYKYIATEIAISSDITTTESLDLFYDKTYTSQDGWVNINSYKLTIDLCGHTLTTKYIEIKNNNVTYDISPITLNLISSGSRGVIKANNIAQYTLMQSTPGTPPNGHMDILIDNITVYGLSIKGNINGSTVDHRVYLKATNSSFIGPDKKAAAIIGSSGEYNPTRSITEFINCSFESEDAAGIIVKNGTNTFESCSFTSNGTFKSTEPYNGNAFAIVQTKNTNDRRIYVTINDSTFNAQDGYALYYYHTISQASFYVTCTLEEDNIYNTKYKKNF